MDRLHTIAIFDDKLQLAGFLELGLGRQIAIELVEPKYADWLRGLADAVRTEPIIVGRDFHGESGEQAINMVEAVPGSQTYAFDVASWINSRSIAAVAITQDLKSFLQSLNSDNITVEQRREVFGDIVNLGQTSASQLKNMAVEINSIIDEIHKNRDEWRRSLDSKIDEFVAEAKSKEN